MSITNLGDQTIHIKYQSSGTSDFFNKWMNLLFQPGIVKGGGLRKTGFNDVEIEPFTLMVRTSEGHLVKVSTLNLVPWTISSTSPYIVCNYTWNSSPANFLDFVGKAVGDINDLDIVFGKANYGAVEASVSGNIDLNGAGNHNQWGTIPEDFNIDFNTMGVVNISLNTNCTNITEVIAEINAEINTEGTYSTTTDFEAYDVGNNQVGFRTINTGATQSLVLSAGTTDALITLGIASGSYVGSDDAITGFDYTDITWHWRYFEDDEEFQIRKDAYIGGDLTIDGNLHAQGLTTQVTDKNVEINKGGTTAGSTGSGLNILGDSDVVVGYMRVDEGDNSLLELKASTGEELVLDINSPSILNMSANLTVELESYIDQDVRKSNEPEWVGVKLTDFTTPAYGTVINSDSLSTVLTADRYLTIDVDNGDRTIKLQGNLEVELDSIIDQDLSQDADVTFNSVSVTAGGIDVGGVITLENTGLHIKDVDDSHDLVIKPHSNLTADRQFRIITGDADRELSMLGNLDVEATSYINQDLTDDATPTFAGLKLVDDTTPAFTLETNSNSFTSPLTTNRYLEIDVDDGDRTFKLAGDLTVESWSVLNQDLTDDADVEFNQVTVGNTGLIVGLSTPFLDSSGTLTLQNVDALDATTETTIENAIDSLPNLVQVNGYTFTINNNLVVESSGSVALNQDLTDDANVNFNRVSLPTGEGVYVNSQQIITDRQATVSNPVDNSFSIVDNSGGTPSGTHTVPVATNIDTLTDSTTGTTNNVMGPMPGATNSVDCSSSINDNFAELTEEMNKQRTLNILLIDAIATIASEYNALRTASQNNNTAIDDIISRLQSHGLIS